MNDGDALEQLVQPVNSAASWAHLYVEDEVDDDDHEDEPLAPATT